MYQNMHTLIRAYWQRRIIAVQLFQEVVKKFTQLVQLVYAGPI